MPQVWDVFNEGYLKRMRRPDFWGFEGDSAFGANMVHGSESINPNANRDASNAKYGALAQPMMNPWKGATYGSPSGRVTNPPILGGNQNTPFSQLMSSTGAMGQNYLTGQIGKNIGDWLSKPSLEGGTEALKNLVATKGMDFASQPVIEKMAGQFGETVSPALTESGLGGYSKLGEMMSTPTDATSGFTFTAPDPISMTAMATEPLGKLIGGETGGKIGRGASAGITTGLAAAQGFANPASDLAALFSLIKFFGGLF